jgi:hypothetical protein
LIAVLSKVEVEDDGFWNGFYMDSLGWYHYFGHRVGMATHNEGQKPLASCGIQSEQANS